MPHGVLTCFLQLFFACGGFLRGAAVTIQTEQTVLAAVGGQASLTCQLSEHKEVIQVTWQKILPDGEKNLATYTKHFGQRVSPDLKMKMDFQYKELQNCSVVIRKVTEQDEGCYRCLFNTFPEGAVIGRTCLRLYGATDPIQTQRTVWTAAGEDAHLSCQLLESKDVHQVTWQKDFKDKKENVGSYDKYFGETVNPGFEWKVEFNDAGLQNTSIVIRNVSEQDEGCYYCLFNADPEGALTGETCLHVYELHGPVLHVREPDSPEESVVSCSATGRPAPTVTLTVTQQHLHFSQHNTVTVTNTNNTVTVTTTAVLSGLHDDSTQVGCAARVDSGPQMEVMKRISELKQTSDDDLTWVVVFPVFLLLCLCVPAFIYWQRNRNKNRDPENIKTPQRTSQDTNETKTPLMQRENENCRLRQSSTKRPENNRLKSSHSSKKKLFKDCCSESDILT